MAVSKRWRHRLDVSNSFACRFRGSSREIFEFWSRLSKGCKTKDADLNETKRVGNFKNRFHSFNKADHNGLLSLFCLIWLSALRGVKYVLLEGKSHCPLATVNLLLHKIRDCSSLVCGRRAPFSNGKSITRKCTNTTIND